MLPNKNATNPAKINSHNVLRFLKAKLREFSDAFNLLEDYKKEQVIWRRDQAKECSANGYCTYCGCSTPGKYYTDDGCDDPVKKCYPDMMSKEEWEKFKITNNITIEIV